MSDELKAVAQMLEYSGFVVSRRSKRLLINRLQTGTVVRIDLLDDRVQVLVHSSTTGRDVWESWIDVRGMVPEDILTSICENISKSVWMMNVMCDNLLNVVDVVHRKKREDLRVN